MKLKIIKLAFFLTSALSLFVGCAASSAPLLTAVTSQRQVIGTNIVTETNTVLVTNVVTTTLTNGVTVTNHVIQTDTVIQTVPVTVTNTVTVTNAYVVSSAVSNTLATVGTVVTATAPIDPYSGILELGLGLLSAGLGYYAKVKSTQAANNLSAAATVITAVEGLAPAAAEGVKAAVTAKSNQMGTTAATSAVVAAVTQNL